MDKPTCKTCFFFRPWTADDMTGQCCLEPPSAETGARPQVDDGDFCAQHHMMGEWVQHELARRNGVAVWVVKPEGETTLRAVVSGDGGEITVETSADDVGHLMKVIGRTVRRMFNLADREEDTLEYDPFGDDSGGFDEDE